LVKLTEIVAETGQINYEQALIDLKVFLYGHKGKIDSELHLQDILFYIEPQNLLFAIRSFSFIILPKAIRIWSDLGFRILHRYFQLNVIAVINKLKERSIQRRVKHEE
jgi:hypothetical protein